MEYYEFLKAHALRAAAVFAAVVGVISVLLGWLGVSGASLATQQLPYLASGGVFGLIAFGMGATLWLSADLKDEWRKLDDIYRLLQGDEPAAGRGRVDLQPLVPEDSPNAGKGRARPGPRAPARTGR